MTGQKRSGGHVGGMLGVDVDVGHRGYNGGEHYVPLFGRILVDTHFHAFEYVDLRRKGEKCIFESGCYIKALFGSACELEHYNMLYHCFGF